ncbi:hypothetical protein PTKIN_Ptkin16aG0089900 [Pterospermum kingtungense]
MVSHKLKFFYGSGVSRFKLAGILSSNPYVRTCSIDICIIPNFNYFKDLTGFDDNDILVAYKHYPGVLQNKFPSLVAPNLVLLRECGVLESNILSELVNHPRVFAASHEKFKKTVEEVKKLGFNPLRQNFLSALQALIQMSKST